MNDYRVRPQRCQEAADLSPRSSPPPPPPPRRRARRRADRRPLGENLRPVIVREATALFAERGFEAATMQELAGKVGITAPGLYYHFPSKQSLLFAVLETALR